MSTGDRALVNDMGFDSDVSDGLEADNQGDEDNELNHSPPSLPEVPTPPIMSPEPLSSPSPMSLTSPSDSSSSSAVDSEEGDNQPELEVAMMDDDGQLSPIHEEQADINLDQEDSGDDNGELLESENSDEESDRESDDDALNLLMPELEEEDIHPDVRDPENEDPPLYAGAPITLLQSILAIWTFASVHNLTGVALADLLSLITMHCIAENRTCLQTLYKFKKYFQNMPSPVKRHYYCSKCFAHLLSKDDNCVDCGNERTGVSYFLELSIISQLKTMFQRPEFYDALGYRFNRVKKNENGYEDIYDGSMYQGKVREGLLRQISEISFCWNSDGLKVFRSSKFSVWPFFLAINELPYSQRFRKENMVLAGLWFGDEKPKLPLFVNAFHNDLEQLYNGVEFEIFGQVEHVQVKGFVLCGTCDLPAKALFLNIKQYNGFFGCPICKVRGERSDRTSKRHAYPPDEVAPLRTDVETYDYGALAEQFRISVYGIKGISSLTMFVRNYITSTACDVMHCVFEGCSKKLMELWFSQKLHDKNFSLRAAEPIVNELLSYITPPSYIKRMPRSVTDHLSYWKASEFKTWLFYYSVPILSNVMTREYLQHHMALVHGIFLLCADSVTNDMVNEAERCLNYYVLNFPRLYDLKYLTLNFHLLLHLPDNVRKFGPLYTTSCMMFEDLNGRIKVLVHGTTHAALQITAGLNQLLNLPLLLSKLNEEDIVKQWCLDLLTKQKIALKENIGESLYSVGNYVKPNILPRDLENALIESNLNGNVTIFHRLKKGKFLFKSQGYTRTTKTKSFAVTFKKLQESCVGLIQLFMKLTDCECVESCYCPGEFFALVDVLDTVLPFRIDTWQITLSHLMQCQRQNVILVPVASLETMCFYFTLNNVCYVVHPVNTVEDE